MTRRPHQDHFRVPDVVGEASHFGSKAIPGRRQDHPPKGVVLTMDDVVHVGAAAVAAMHRVVPVNAQM